MIFFCLFPLWQSTVFSFLHLLAEESGSVPSPLGCLSTDRKWFRFALGVARIREVALLGDGDASLFFASM